MSLLLSKYTRTRRNISEADIGSADKQIHTKSGICAKMFMSNVGDARKQKLRVKYAIIFPFEHPILVISLD